MILGVSLFQSSVTWDVETERGFFSVHIDTNHNGGYDDIVVADEDGNELSASDPLYDEIMQAIESQTK